MAHTLKKPSRHIDLSMAIKAIDCANDGISSVDVGQPDQPLIFIKYAVKLRHLWRRYKAHNREAAFNQVFVDP